jgi:hypothetical protein
MTSPKCLVVTSISGPNHVLSSLAAGAVEHGIPFFLIGDVASPAEFSLEGCRFYSIAQQEELEFRIATLTPKRHYARKNIGYLLAIQNGAEIIVETDDDNFPRSSFWENRNRMAHAATLGGAGWVNAYRYFADVPIWPRGLPLEAIHNRLPEFETLRVGLCDCPIQQGLADENPDVDAIYRLALPLPVRFRSDRALALTRHSWCPFNSQNTTWWADCFPLLYLPAYCSFRMTDIWRSFVAQRIAWANDWSILFSQPTVWQDRNDHKLMADFEDEVPGYLNNRRICEAFDLLPITPGPNHIPDGLRLCYETLIKMGLIGSQEMTLVDAWLADLWNIVTAKNVAGASFPSL